MFNPYYLEMLADNLPVIGAVKYFLGHDGLFQDVQLKRYHAIALQSLKHIAINTAAFILMDNYIHKPSHKQTGREIKIEMPKESLRKTNPFYLQKGLDVFC